MLFCVCLCVLVSVSVCVGLCVDFHQYVLACIYLCVFLSLPVCVGSVTVYVVVYVSVLFCVHVYWVCQWECLGLIVCISVLVCLCLCVNTGGNETLFITDCGQHAWRPGADISLRGLL